MFIDLNHCALDTKLTLNFSMDERLPYYLLSVNHLCCEATVVVKPRYWLIYLHTQALLKINCQRCNQNFEHFYQHSYPLAVCQQDAYAGELMKDYEVIVEPSKIVDLTAVITDGLYLYAPEKHIDKTNCEIFIKDYKQNSE